MFNIRNGFEKSLCSLIMATALAGSLHGCKHHSDDDPPTDSSSSSGGGGGSSGGGGTTTPVTRARPYILANIVSNSTSLPLAGVEVELWELNPPCSHINSYSGNPYMHSRRITTYTGFAKFEGDAFKGFCNISYDTAPYIPDSNTAHPYLECRLVAKGNGLKTLQKDFTLTPADPEYRPTFYMGP